MKTPIPFNVFLRRQKTLLTKACLITLKTVMPQIQSTATTNTADRLKHILIAWILFSTVYWIAAYNKPYHVDEFYSWVYAERCTFKDIFLLKEFGIGHPPLFHLVQKSVQSLFPTYHPAQVRLANYLFGSVFVMLLVSMLSHYRNIPVS